MENTTKKMTPDNELRLSPNIGMPAAAFGQLAAQARASGLFVAAIASDGQIINSDSQPSQFFSRYVLPCLNHQRADFAGQSDDLRINIINTIPGLIVATFAILEKGRIVTRLLLVGKSERFTFNDAISRTCAEQVIDESWLGHVIPSIPSFTAATMIDQVGLIKRQRHLLAA